MPSLANITIKKNDGTTDIVYNGVSPSSGDSTPAIWKSQTVGSALSHQPEFRLLSNDVNKGTKRHLRGTFMYPEIASNSTTGLTSVAYRALGTYDVNVPKDMSAANVNEFVSQFANLLASTLIKDCCKQGYSAT